MDKEIAKIEIEKIVSKFLSIPKNELDEMPEEQIKFRFIEPLFEALGWEREDIFKEKRILKGRADYILKIGNQDKLVIEAKKTNIRLSEDEGRQAVSYAYHKNIKFSVVTNFKQIRIYHALSNIKNIDKNLLKDKKGHLWLNCEDFVKDFDRLWFLSKESFEKEEINKLLENVDKRLIRPIDKSILEDLLLYREWLSKDLKEKRMHLTDSQIDEIVQILIDRLIFMRSAEDRGLEEGEFLLKKVNEIQKGITDKNLWALLLIQFKIFDKEYNSKLFSESLLEKEGFFDDKTLMKVIRGLYDGTTDNQERYMFDEIPVDLLGSIYEQYLGVVLRGTEKRVKLDSASGKRKKMGIYYTPAYIVDYIIKNTVGEYVKDKSIDEILNIKIVDPACGSGSFLIKAFQELIDVVEERLKKGEKSKNYTHTFQEWKEKLSLGEKATILKNCIYGVDLDEKAVELAQLNLLLKVLEEETRETRRRILPNMKDNIMNGNSLISDSNYEKAFNWNAQFPEVFRNGGFDIVVGNPPYIRNRELKIEEKKYMNKRFETTEGQWDIYQLFFELSIWLLKENGLLGFITSNKYAITNAGKKIRKFLLENANIKEIIDVSNFSVFKDASTYPYILIFEKTKSVDKDNKILISKITSEKDIKNTRKNYIQQINFLKNNGFVFDINTSSDNSRILDKISKDAILLKDISIIKETVHTGNIRERILLTESKSIFCKKILRGKDCQRYYFSWDNLWINTDDKEINKKKGEYATIPNKSFFEKPKIFLREIAEKITCCFDSEGFYSLNKAYVLNLKEEGISIKYLLGLLNSKLLSWFFRCKFESAHVRGGHLQFKKQYTSQLPIHLPLSSTQEQKIISFVNQMLELQKKYHSENLSGNEKEQLEQQIKNVDYEIDEEVYKLYGITEEEKKIIEESLR